MTATVIPPAGAPSTLPIEWDFIITWKPMIAQVRRLQMRIAKAHREGKRGKVKALQRLLTHSFYAKLLAVKRVTDNQGAKTPGVDKVVWNTGQQKMLAVHAIKRRGYKTKPLKRIYIPKKQKGKLRPLSIPVMMCRAQQALYLLTLEPIAELEADKNAYGFRPLRSTADAIAQCFNALAQKSSAQYILEGDIRACFDSISHAWLLNNIPMDKTMLRKWLSAGYIEQGKLHPTDFGTPQGGLISPTLLVLTLSGLEETVKAAVGRGDKVNICIYADDFIITGVSKEVLMNKVKPVVENFLSERGLTLSTEKTKLTHINEGFEFLGMNIRKYNGKLIIKPAKSSIKRFLANIRDVIKSNATSQTENLLRLLNPRIQGWSNYYRHVCSKQTFGLVDHLIFKAIWCWAIRRHPNKNRRWIKQKYFRSRALQNWVFSTKIRNKKGKTFHFDLKEASKVQIKRHIKVRADATPYDPTYHKYFNKRTRKEYDEWVCWWNFLKPAKINIDEAELRRAA